jgi:hypothetical protein
VYLVDVRLFRGEVNVFADFVAHAAEELVVDEILDDSMLVTGKSLDQGASKARMVSYGCDFA